MNEKALFERLDRHNAIIQQMLDIMPRSAGRFTRVLDTSVLIVGTLGIISIAETIVKWIKGG